MSNADIFKQAILLAKAGERDKARQMLAQLVLEQPGHELAWLWLSDLVDAAPQRRYCLQRALEINPHNAAARRKLEAPDRADATASRLEPAGEKEPVKLPPSTARHARLANVRYAWIAAMGALLTLTILAALNLIPRVSANNVAQAGLTLSPTATAPAHSSSPTATASPTLVRPATTRPPAQPASTPTPSEFDALLRLTLTPTPPNDLVQPYLERAAQHAGQEQFDRAWDEYGRALTAQPDHVEALYQRAALSFQLGRSSRALDDLNRALDVNPKLVKAYVLRGQVFAALLRYHDALRDLGAALALEPTCAEAWYQRGAVYLQLEENQNALYNFNKALECRPDWAEAVVGRGDAYLRLGELTLARINYQNALNHNNKLAGAALGLGRIALASGDYEQAVQYLYKALGASPGDEDAMMYLGQALVLAGRYQEAVSTLNLAIRAVTPAPKQAAMYEWRGRAHYALGHYGDAINDLTLAIARYPSGLRFYYRALAYQAAGNLGLARRDFEQSLQSGELEAALQQDAQERLKKVESGK